MILKFLQNVWNIKSFFFALFFSLFLLGFRLKKKKAFKIFAYIFSVFAWNLSAAVTLVCARVCVCVCVCVCVGWGWGVVVLVEVTFKDRALLWNGLGEKGDGRRETRWMPVSNYWASVSWHAPNWLRLWRRLTEMRIYYKLIKLLFFVLFFFWPIASV